MYKRLWDMLGDQWAVGGVEGVDAGAASLAGSRLFSKLGISYSVLAMFAIAVLLSVWSSRQSKQHPSEPPLAATSVPVVGHLIGLLRHQLKYFDILSTRNSWPVFTINIFGSRTYVVRSPWLVHAALSNPKAFSFDPFSIMFSRKALAGTKQIMTIMEHIPTEKGESAYLIDLHTAMYGALALGPSLLDTNKKVLNSIAGYLNGFGTQNQPRSLYSWLKVLYTMSSAHALYGANNPFTYDLALVEYVWDFEETFNMLMLDVFPKYTAQRACKARDALTTAFTRYYETGQDRAANQFVQGRAAVCRKWGFTSQDCASFEIGIIYASTTNATPTAFWMLCYILSDPELSARISAEVTQLVTVSTISGVKRASLDITCFQSKCPLLVACFHETMRLVNAGTSVRWVMEDTMLDDKYLLKKNGIIQLPAAVMHMDESIWGPQPEIFDPNRFLDLDGLTKEQRKLRKDGFIPFGGGRHLCPGRHLAFTEIVSFVAMAVLGFDVRMDNGHGRDGGYLKLPQTQFMKWGNNTRKPDGDVDVLIKRKPEWEDCTWSFDIGDEVDFENLSPE